METRAEPSPSVVAPARRGDALEIVDGWRYGELLDPAVVDLAPFVVAPGSPLTYEHVKRLMDVLIAGLLLVVTSPLFLAVSIMIKLDTRGPVLFRQRRLGRDLEPFEFIKFRTMVTDARSTHPELYNYQFSPEEVRRTHFKYADDPRLTRVGRWIRRTSLDELPNLLNVLRGDMSMVGPRPEIPEMLPYYRPEELCKFAVLPGVTGLAQASGRNILVWGETNAFDVEYVHTRGIRTDVRVMAKTVGAVAGMIGAL